MFRVIGSSMMIFQSPFGWFLVQISSAFF